MRALLMVMVLALAQDASAMRRVHRQPLATGCSQIGYHGGHLIHEVKVVLVLWGAATQYGNELAQFYSAVVQSPYLDWLDEYDRGTEAIRRGTFVGTFTDPSPPAATTVDDAMDVEPELERLAAAGLIPPPDDDTLYMVHFPPGVVITLEGASSCNNGPTSEFCAFHNSIQGAKSFRYSVIPDMSDANCTAPCGSGASNDPFIAATFSGSHELMEALTDPDPPTGWLDESCGELADICDGDPSPGEAGGYVVERIWSVRQNDCVDRPGPRVTQDDFTLSLTASSLKGKPGQQVSTRVQALPIGGLITVSLAVDGLPASIVADLQDSLISSDGSTVLGLDLGNAAPGVYHFRVTGMAGSSHSVTGTLTVNQPTGDPPNPSSPPDMAGPNLVFDTCVTNADCPDGLCVLLPGQGQQCVPYDMMTEKKEGGCSFAGGATGGGLFSSLILLFGLVFGLRRKPPRGGSPQ